MELEGVRPLLAIKLLSHKAALVTGFVLGSREHELVVEADICIFGPSRSVLNKQRVSSPEGHFVAWGGVIGGHLVWRELSG